MSTRSLAAAIALALSLVGCPAPVPSGTDAAMPIADVGVDAASVGCSPAGTYDIVWTAEAGNTSSCTAPSSPLTIAANGIPLQSSGAETTCPTGCDAAHCTIRGVGATCDAEVRLDPPCGAITSMGHADVTFTFTAGGATIDEIATTPTMTCNYHGVATRR
jgi:hypothetical protein